MSRWFRHYAGMMSDPKFGGVARFCKRSRAEVLFVWGCLLESASECDSAFYSWDADAIAELLAIDTEEAQAIHDALEAKGLIAGGRIAAWDKRQFKSDDSSQRVKEHRERQKAAKEAARNASETACNGDVTPPDTETETDTSKGVEPEQSAATGVATVRGSPKIVSDKPKAKPVWLTEPDFCALWNGCTADMRRRSESREKTYGHYRRQAHLADGGGVLVRCMEAYLRADPDVKRTGGPGLHLWLRDGVWEHWLDDGGGTAGGVNVASYDAERARIKAQIEAEEAA